MNLDFLIPAKSTSVRFFLEFDMFGIDFKKRAQLFEDTLAVLRKAWTGEQFKFDARTVRVTPVPVSVNGPTIYIGGNAKPSQIDEQTRLQSASLFYARRPAMRVRSQAITRHPSSTMTIAPLPYR